MTDTRQRLMGANALLYFGPLLAGLGGFGWHVVPVFVGLFLLWLVVLRPQNLPRARGEWVHGETFVRLASRAAVQVLLVVLCFGIGRGIGGVLGALPHFPLMLPIAISFLAIPLARLIWDPWQAGTPVDPEAGAPRIEEPQAPASRMVQPLLTLGPQTPLADIQAHLVALAPHVEARALQDALLSAARSGQEIARNALIMHVTMPVVAKSLLGSNALRDAYAVATQSPATLHLWASATRSLLATVPAARADCPSVGTLRAQAALSADFAATALRELAAELDHAT